MQASGLSAESKTRVLLAGCTAAVSLSTGKELRLLHGEWHAILDGGQRCASVRHEGELRMTGRQRCGHSGWAAQIAAGSRPEFRRRAG